jgi:hypothetical protein
MYLYEQRKQWALIHKKNQQLLNEITAASTFYASFLKRVS